jgi:hypothetical protein
VLDFWNYQRLPHFLDWADGFFDRDGRPFSPMNEIHGWLWIFDYLN